MGRLDRLDLLGTLDKMVQRDRQELEPQAQLDQRDQHRRLPDPPDRLELDLPDRPDRKVHRACKVSKGRLDQPDPKAFKECKGTREPKALLDQPDRKVSREFRELPVSRDQRVLEQRDQRVLEQRGQRGPKDRREFKVPKERLDQLDPKAFKECKGTKECKGQLDRQDRKVSRGSRAFRGRPETPGQLGTQARQVPDRPAQREKQAR
jgi:hypothetical protein